MGWFSPSDDIILSSYWLRSVPVVIPEREVCSELVMLNMTDYDVILGMDFSLQVWGHD